MHDTLAATADDLDAARKREAATREILEVISQSRDDERPVFDAVLHSAALLCGADSAALLLGRPDGPHLTLAALKESGGLSVAELDRFIAEINRVPMHMDPSLHVSAQAICSGKVVHIADVAQTEGYLSGERTFRSMVDVQGIRTILSVPLFDAEGTRGAINLHRREVRMFNDDQIALIETFAAQAIIAIENVRQFRELQSRLEREKASAAILEVISQSRDDEGPVFDAILSNAARLCKAPIASLGLVNPAGTHLVMAAMYGKTMRTHRKGDSWPMDPSPGPVARSILSARIGHIHDLADTEEYRGGHPTYVGLVDEDGLRTDLSVPLLRDGVGFGAIILSRSTVEPFNDPDIALIETFAAQAVIAIENVRQFRELQVRLEREAATREILEVISQSRDDDKPVFDAVLRSANRLCGTSMATLMLGRPADALMTLAAYLNPYVPSKDALDQLIAYANQTGMRMDASEHFSAQAILSGEVVQIADLAKTHGYLSGEPTMRIIVEDMGVHTILSVPLFDAQGAMGAISLHRREAQPFRDDEITLIQSFAAQAVIAIENVRQFRELQERLEREAATREILEVISQSRDDDTPVFDLIARSAARLCGAAVCTFWRVENGLIHYCASHGFDDADFEDMLLTPKDGPAPLGDNSLTGIAVKTRAVARIEDGTAESYVNHEWARAHGLRQLVGVPIFVGDEVWGSINLMWQGDRGPRDTDIQLVENFAAQAVIAIENVRQFRELQVRLEREAATREILEVISQSRDDDRPVFEVVLRKAADLCGVSLASLNIISEDRSHAVTVADWGFHVTDQFPVGTVWPMESNSATSTCMREGRIVHFDDMADTDLYRSGDPVRVAAVDELGIRTFLAVPLFSGGRTVGCISAFRREVKPFKADEIALVETFAAQAVIAIENVRQFRELQTRLAREAATREILEVISRNPDDDRPVFDVILRNVIKLCAGDTSALLMGRKDDPRMTMAAWRDRESASSVMDDVMIAQMNATEMLMDPRVHISAQAIIEARNIHVLDAMQHPSYLAGEPSYRIMGDALGVRSALVVPLIDARGALGTVHVHRRAVRPFSGDEIALVETFAAQAVIAIENVRQFRELQTRLEREEATREILSVISQSRDDDRPVFDMIARSAARLCGAAVCTFWRVEDGLIHYCASHGLDSASFEDTRSTPSIPLLDTTLLGQVVKTRAVVRIEDGTADSYHDHEWARAQGLRQLIGVPIFVRDDVWGSINLMWPADRAPLDADIQLVESFADQASIAIENVRQFRALEALNAELGDRVQAQVGEIERMGRLKRFLPAAVANTVISSGSEKMLSSHRALLGVLFCDIRGFTAFCETAEPEETIEVLQTYHEEMGRLIEAHGAGVDHRMGDGIMVLFNDPLPCDDPAGAAVRLAMAMRDRMAELCARWKKMGHRLGFGVGISLGYATVGMVGSGGRQDYTASGTAVNLAARLCDEALDGEILVSPRAATAVEGSFAVEGRGERSLKGIREPVELFWVTGVAAG